jgi:hypothetical protein
MHSEAGKMRYFRFIPELSLGHVIQGVMVIIPAVLFWVRLDAKVVEHDVAILKLGLKAEKLDETTNLLARNQAVLTALFEAHRAAQAQRETQNHP